MARGVWDLISDTKGDCRIEVDLPDLTSPSLIHNRAAHLRRPRSIRGRFGKIRQRASSVLREPDSAPPRAKASVLAPSIDVGRSAALCAPVFPWLRLP